MAVLNPTLQSDVHFPIRVACAAAALAAVAGLWYIGIPALQSADPAAAVSPQECTASAEKCLELWLSETVSNVQQPIGTIVSTAD